VRGNKGTSRPLKEIGGYLRKFEEKIKNATLFLELKEKENNKEKSKHTEEGYLEKIGELIRHK